LHIVVGMTTATNLMVTVVKVYKSANYEEMAYVE